MSAQLAQRISTLYHAALLADVTKLYQGLMLPNGTNKSAAEVQAVAHMCTPNFSWTVA